MTRFARAKGSKSSNERVPEQSTPWHIMKQQLLENINDLKNKDQEKQVNEQKIANYRAFLKEKEDDDIKHAVWASFPVQKNKSLLLNGKAKKINVNAKKVDNKTKEIQIKKKIQRMEVGTENIVSVSDNTNKLSQKKMRKDPDGTEKINIKTGTKEKSCAEKSDANLKIRKAMKRKVVVANIPKTKKSVTKKSELTEPDLQKIAKKKQKKLKQLQKKKEFKAKKKDQEEHNINDSENNLKVPALSNEVKEIIKLSDNEINKNPIEKNKKFKKQLGPIKNKKDNTDYHRKKPLLPHKMFVNGKEIEVAYIEGFPVKKEDAARLKKLRKEMISKGLPRSQIDVALKLERRKAEKSLAREKKKVCFNCRKSGHNLSECPELGKNQLVETTGSGICFKCGSAEHTHFECKVVKGQDYKFAQCFICNEQGHIARQCPDNARGLYPKGGACNMCGDVTHLKKDCPQYQAQQHKQENNLMVQTLGSSNPEMQDEGNVSFAIHKNQNKIIKFV